MQMRCFATLFLFSHLVYSFNGVNIKWPRSEGARLKFLLTHLLKESLPLKALKDVIVRNRVKVKTRKDFVKDARLKLNRNQF